MKKLIVLSFAFLVLISCNKKEDTTNPEPQPGPDPATKYYPLTIGSYWVYENVRIDTNGTELVDDFRDSLKVSRDTIINDLEYAIIEGKVKFGQNPNQWKTRLIIRDSSGYMVDHTGGILFSANNFTDTLHTRVQLYNDDQDTLFISHYSMHSPDDPVTIEAGTFPVISYQAVVFMPKANPPVPQERDHYHDYAKGVGLVRSNLFYLSSATNYEKRLLHYHIAE